MDLERFAAARAEALSRVPGAMGIGTRSEKALHATLKAYYEPDEESREVQIGTFVADIVGENGIIEIQTRSFNRLRPKLTAFLQCAPVTVVYPVALRRALWWIDKETGEVAEQKKSVKSGVPFDAFRELYQIKSLLQDPNLTVCLVLLEITDCRYLDGYGEKRKIRSTRGERIPEKLCDELVLRTPRDYRALLPENLPETFTTRDLARLVRRPINTAQCAVNVLYTLGVLERTGKVGQLYTYKIKEDEPTV